MANGDTPKNTGPVNVTRVRIVECKYPQLDKDGMPKEEIIGGEKGKQYTATALLPLGVAPEEIKTWKDFNNAVSKTSEIWDSVRAGSPVVNSKGNTIEPKPFSDGETRARACATEERFIPREIVSLEFSPAAAFEKFMQGIEAPIRTAINNALRENFSLKSQEEGTSRVSEKNQEF